MISSDLRHALARAVAAAEFGRAVDPGLRPTGTPGQYAASAALALGGDPRATARMLAATLAREPWIETAEVTGPGYLTITVTPEALAAVADNVIAAGLACVTSDALAGVTVPATTADDLLTGPVAPAEVPLTAPAVPVGDPLTAPTWEEARAALAARLTARLAAAAGATVREFPGTERKRLSPQATNDRGTEVARAVAYAGRDAVLFTLARAIPGRLPRVEQEIIARHVLDNPAYAVRYAHARAASEVRWAAGSLAADTIGSGETGPLPRETTEMLDALSWLPERVATAARRGRPDEFARYLEDLASVTVDVLSSASHPGRAGRGKEAVPGSDRLALAKAAQAGLAAGLGLLEVSAPERL